MASCQRCDFSEWKGPHWPEITCWPDASVEDTCPHSCKEDQEGPEEWRLAFPCPGFFLRGILPVSFTKTTRWQAAQDRLLSVDRLLHPWASALLTLLSTVSSALASCDSPQSPSSVKYTSRHHIHLHKRLQGPLNRSWYPFVQHRSLTDLRENVSEPFHVVHFCSFYFGLGLANQENSSKEQEWSYWNSGSRWQQYML